MSFTDVMYGGLGQLNNQFQANLGQNAAMNQGNQAAIQQQQINNAAQQAQLAALYGPMGFGGQTAAYAAAGAAAGRNTGGFGGLGAANADPFSPVGGYNPIDAQAGGGGGINPNDAANIALYYQIMQGGSPYGAYPSGATNAPQSSYGYGLTSGGNFSSPSLGFGASSAATDPASQAYFAAYPDVAASGMSAAQHYQQFGAAEGRNGFGLGGAPVMAQGGDTSWFDAGQPGGGFVTYGMPGSGNIGKQDAFSGMQNLDTPEAKYLNANPDVLAWARGSGMDYQTAARQHAAQYGNNEGRDTFGMTNANPNFQQGGGFGMGNAFDPGTYGGTTGNPGSTFNDRFGQSSPDFGGAGQFDPNSFANRFAAGGYYNPGTPAQVSGVQPGGYDPLSGAQPPYTYQPGMVQGMGGPGDWVRQQIPGMQTLSPNDMTYGKSPFVNLPGG